MKPVLLTFSIPIILGKMRPITNIWSAVIFVLSSFILYGTFQGLLLPIDTVTGSTIMIENSIESPVSNNQSGTVESLKASEIISLEAQSPNPAINKSSLSRVEEATDESFESFQIPTADRDIPGPINGTQTNATSNRHPAGLQDLQTLPAPLSVRPEGGLQTGGRDIIANQTLFGTADALNFDVATHEVTAVPKDVRSLVGETSVASNNKTVFYTGNWYAARSDDGGNTWKYLNSSEDFGDFCCDQRVVYEPNHKLFIWYRQGISDLFNENIVRIGVSSDAVNWTMYDILSSSLDPSFAGYWFDYPELATSNNFAYITTNAFPRSDDMTAVIMRLNLTELSKGSVDLEYYSSPGIFTFTPVHGATDKMYWATHLANNIMRIYEWNDFSPSTDVRYYDREVDPWFVLSKGIGKCSALTSVTGQYMLEGNWCARADSRISTGWLYGNKIGFFWNADAGSTTERGATFPWPYINAATFDTDKNMTYTGRPYVWSQNYPWLYASSAPNALGEIAIIGYYGNAINIPGLALGVRATPEMAEPWNMISLANSSSPPELEFQCGTRGMIDPSICRLPDLVDFVYKWGDYITVRPHQGSGPQWDIAAYVLEGGGSKENTMPYYFLVSNSSRIEN